MDGSSGRSYVTNQWHNVPLLHGRGLNQSTDLVQVRYLGSSCKYLEPFFSFPPIPNIKGSSYEKKIKNFDFLKNGSYDFH